MTRRASNLILTQMPSFPVVRFGLFGLAGCFALAVLVAEVGSAAERIRISVDSSIDGSPQPSYLVLPDNYGDDSTERPLLVSLHSWSGDLEQRNRPLEELANRRGWIVLCPNFRGRNDHPEACGSDLAQQDVLDAVEWTRENHRVDERRIFLTGNSGGGHMTLLMAGRYPDVWTAASAWVGISDLAAWHARHADGNYGAMLRKSCGGRPGDSDEVDRQYRERSPLTHLAAAAALPLDIAAGIHDGHEGSVPIRHSLDAFNVVARAAGAKLITEAEIEQLSQPGGRLEQKRASDRVDDPAVGRAIYLRRHTPVARVTIFEGGHEGIATAAIDWFDRHVGKAD